MTIPNNSNMVNPTVVDTDTITTPIEMTFTLYSNGMKVVSASIANIDNTNHSWDSVIPQEYRPVHNAIHLKGMSTDGASWDSTYIRQMVLYTNGRLVIDKSVNKGFNITAEYF